MTYRQWIGYGYVIIALDMLLYVVLLLTGLPREIAAFLALTVFLFGCVHHALRGLAFYVFYARRKRYADMRREYGD